MHVINKNQKGVSLIEALIATMIFMIAFISFASLQISSLETVRDGFVKKTVTDSGSDFIGLLHADLYSKKNATDKATLISNYLDQEWEIKPSKCNNDVITACISSTGLSDVNKCPESSIIQLKTLVTQCQLMNSVPSAKMKLEKCDGSDNLYCLNVAWNGDAPNYEECKEFDKNCITFEVLP